MNDACITYGPLIAVVVATLKRIPWLGGMIARNAKLVAMLASTVLSLVTAGAIPVSAAQWATFAACVGTVFAGSVATHEVIDPLGKSLGLSDPKAKG